MGMLMRRHKDRYKTAAPAPAQPVPEAPPAPGPVSKLPENLPGRPALEAAGLLTLEAVTSHEDLTQIKGIGKATAVAIAEFLIQAAAADNDGKADDKDEGDSQADGNAVGDDHAPKETQEE